MVCRRTLLSWSSMSWTAYLTLNVANPVTATSASQNSEARRIIARAPRRNGALRGQGWPARAEPRCVRPRADGPCVAFLAEVADQLGEGALLETGNQIGGARPMLSHAHVERTVEAKRKAALGAVELRRRNPEIQCDAGDRVGRYRANQPIHLTK